MEASESLAYLASAAVLSDDPRTHNAARLYEPFSGLFGPVVANQVPRCLSAHRGRLRPPEKACYIEHAERAAIYAAATEEWGSSGCELHCLWAACPDCARAIMLAGIRTVHTAAATFAATPDRWRLQVRTGLAMLEEAGVDVVFHRKVGGSILFNGEELEI